MMLTVTASLPTILRYWPDPDLARMAVPGNMSRLKDTVDAGIPLMADNGAFKKFDRRAYEAMLDRLEGLPILWVVAPDVVADAKGTIELFDVWQPKLKDRGFPVAFVLQDGQEDLLIPWDRLDCLFIGGSSYFKVSDFALNTAIEAKARGKRTHMGRAGSFDRFQLARRSGVIDSVDGSKFGIWDQSWLFSTSHSEKVMVGAPRLRVNEGSVA